MLKSLRFEKGVVGRGVKAIIWEEKKNDLSSGCQQRKRLCIGQRERAWLGGLSRHLCAWMLGHEAEAGKGFITQSVPWPWLGCGCLGLDCPHVCVIEGNKTQQERP